MDVILMQDTYLKYLKNFVQLSNRILGFLFDFFNKTKSTDNFLDFF
jgi:hypothetical protein